MKFNSITARLTTLFTVASGVLLTLLAALLLYATRAHFDELDRVAVEDKHRLISDILSRARSGGDARSRLTEALDHHHGLLVSIVEPDGDVLYRSAEWEQLEASDREADLAVVQTGMSGSPLKQWHADGKLYQGIETNVRPAYQTNGSLIVRIAVDTASHDSFISELKNTLGIYGSIAITLSAVLAWVVSYTALTPLRDMKSRAMAVSAERLDERMSVESVPAEMADLAAELNTMLSRLQTDFMKISDFAADLAHELRTPISNLLTQTQVSLSTKRSADVYEEILASNAEELQRLGRMVSDMLFLVKTERGVDLPNKEHFSADQEIKTLLEFYDAVAEEHEVSLHQRGEGEMMGDRIMFRRALSNLLSNALRHADRGSEVDVHIAQQDRGTRVAVTNHGQDIPSDILPKIFDRFFRGSGAGLHLSEESTGLGLAITRAIAEAHGGTISVESKKGATRFTLWFPHP